MFSSAMSGCLQSAKTAALTSKLCDALLKCYTTEILEMDKVRAKDGNADSKV